MSAALAFWTCFAAGISVGWDWATYDYRCKKQKDPRRSGDPREWLFG